MQESRRDDRTSGSLSWAGLLLRGGWGAVAFLAFPPDPFEEFGRGLIAPALLAGEVGFGGDELAAEGFGEDGLLELPSPHRGFGHPVLDVIGQLGIPTANSGSALTV